MPHLGGGVREGLLAEVAVVWLLAAVHQLVALQIARSGEKLPTNFTAVSSFACVPFVVQVEQADLAVALSTSRAAVRFQGAKIERQLTLRQKSDRAQREAVCRNMRR